MKKIIILILILLIVPVASSYTLMDGANENQCIFLNGILLKENNPPKLICSGKCEGVSGEYYPGEDSIYLYCVDGNKTDKLFMTMIHEYTHYNQYLNNTSCKDWYNTTTIDNIKKYFNQECEKEAYATQWRYYNNDEYMIIVDNYKIESKDYYSYNDIIEYYKLFNESKIKNKFMNYYNKRYNIVENETFIEDIIDIKDNVSDSIDNDNNNEKISYYDYILSKIKNIFKNIITGNIFKGGKS